MTSKKSKECKEHMEDIMKDTVVKETKEGFISLCRYCMNVLRDGEHLTGDKALRAFTKFINFALISRHFEKTIDFDNFDYESANCFDEKDKDKRDEQIKLRLQLCRFKNMKEYIDTKEKNKEVYNLHKILDVLWSDILHINPQTKEIFPTPFTVDITHASTIRKIIDRLTSFNFESLEDDILGEAYEEVIKDIMIGKTLGQYFTPLHVKQLIIDLVKPKLLKNGKTETIFDPAMGTGGFLISAVRHFQKQSKKDDIPINWAFVSEKGIGGREIEPDTFQLAKSNMLISSGHLFKNVDCKDSIFEPTEKTYDIVMANPPFGISGLEYSAIKTDIKNKFMPIKSNSAIPLFLQLIINILNKNGRCGVVLPDGKELFAKNLELVAIRQYLMKTCDLQEVIILPKDTFTHTTILTCVLYFVKKVDSDKVLEVSIKTNKKGVEDRSYKFVDDLQTKSVKFYDYDFESKTKKLIVDVDIEKIKNNSYSLKYTEYIKTDDETYDGVDMMALGDVCNVKNGSNITKDKLVPGEYNVIGGGKSFIGKHSKYNVNENTIIISKDGAYAGYVSCYQEKMFVTNHGLYITNISKKISEKFLYYYLKNTLQEKLFSLQRGTAQPGVNKDEIEHIKIPVPSLVEQQKYIDYCDSIDEKTKKLEEEKQKLKDKIEKTTKDIPENIKNIILRKDKPKKPVKEKKEKLAIEEDMDEEDVHYIIEEETMPFEKMKKKKHEK